MMPEPRPGPRPATTRMSSHRCRRASSSKTRTASAVPHRCAYCRESRQAGAHVGTDGRAETPGSASGTWASDAPQGTIDRWSGSVDPVDPVFEQAALGQQRAAGIVGRPRSRGQMSTLGASLAVEPVVDLRGTGRSRAASSRPAAGARRGTTSCPVSAVDPAGPAGSRYARRAVGRPGRRGRPARAPARSAAGPRPRRARAAPGPAAWPARAARPRGPGSGPRAGIEQEAHVAVAALARRRTGRPGVLGGDPGQLRRARRCRRPGRRTNDASRPARRGRSPP